MARLIFFVTLLVHITTATAQGPIPRVGESCPTGTYKSGDYCKRLSSSDREALPRESGKDCPTGWRKSDGYCVKQGE